MKRIISIMLALLLLGNVSFAETSEVREMSPEEQAYNIYLDITYAYEYGVRYLEEMGRIWGIALDAKDVAAVNKLCYMDCFTTESLATLYAMYGDKYGYSQEEIRRLCFSGNVFSVSQKTDIIWIVLALEEESKYLKSPVDLKSNLDRAFENIRILMANETDYPFLAELKAYYKDAVTLNEYISNFKDSYADFSTKLDKYQTNQTSWKVDFEFIFDPNEYSYVYELRTMQQSAEYKEIYDQAKVHETEGDYELAISYYWLCSSYEDAYERMSICVETLKEQQYQTAIELQSSGQYDQAILVYQEIGAYKDSKKRITICKSKIILDKLFPNGISFDLPKSDFVASLNKLGVDNKEYPEKINAEDILFGSRSVAYRFESKANPLQLTSVYYNLYGNSTASEANSIYTTALDKLTKICGTPYATTSNRSRPTYNEIEGNTARLISGPAYKDSDFDGEITNFSEWLVDTGEYYVNVIVYNKYFPAHRFYEVSVLYETVPYAAAK